MQIKKAVFLTIIASFIIVCQKKSIEPSSENIEYASIPISVDVGYYSIDTVNDNDRIYIPRDQNIDTVKISLAQFDTLKFKNFITISSSNSDSEYTVVLDSNGRCRFRMNYSVIEFNQDIIITMHPYSGYARKEGNSTTLELYAFAIPVIMYSNCPAPSVHYNADINASINIYVPYSLRIDADDTTEVSISLDGKRYCCDEGCSINTSTLSDGDQVHKLDFTIYDSMITEGMHELSVVINPALYDKYGKKIYSGTIETLSSEFYYDTSPPIARDLQLPKIFHPDSLDTTKQMQVRYYLDDNLSTLLKNHMAYIEYNGERILTTREDRILALGSKIFYWNGRDSTGLLVQPGIYDIFISSNDQAGNAAIIDTSVRIEY